MKKKKPKAIQESPEMLDKAAEDFAEVVVNSFRENYHSEMEPFEAYAARIKAKIYDDITEFRSRFAKGYHVLLDELGKKNKSE